MSNITSYRRANGIIRDDFMQMLMQIKDNYNLAQLKDKNKFEVKSNLQNENDLGNNLFILSFTYGSK